MIRQTRYENKKVLVLGLALSGFHAAKLLLKLGAFVTVNDAKELENNPDAQELVASGIRVIAGYHPVELLDESFAYIIKNPGIPYSNPMLERATELAIPILTEVELAAEVMEADLIGVTGTNGKTTTTTMIHELLDYKRPAGKAYKAGNIGIPAAAIAQEATKDDDIVMELSSFQLMGIDEMHPSIAVITNITEAHIDYHGTRDAYVEAKWRITENQTENDYLILNWDQEELRELSKNTKAKIVPFSRKEEIKNGAYLKDDMIYFNEASVMPISDIHVPGLHNIENALAAIAVAKLKGIENDIIHEALSQFGGVKHRIQFVKEINGRSFYNDSKSTNIVATKTALESFPNNEIILLAGGLDRGNSFDELIPYLDKVKAMILFGETKEKLQETAEKAAIKIIKLTENVETAVAESYRISEKEDVILLSPACASWDQYKNFEVRGDLYIHAVQELKAD
ncbi:UDP-N-acetylmuramoyl-L-alanine--D-glutamate ligase [Jeotgalibaca ciconiae]|uniref:UDP-N-acetylmuramoylalanine--D-glutamate ligase n=1 Tax=Jeotgalibaca ciconiae TaxID=2496265 RepID=A0A3Q9BLF4_9LACT|nr:UDP-N-acetylmuramoyl-L-alanine--D-glutamate ligase [Jeotgalibaca ciconiae]AZP05091.1 UDP-N-acetylmuramoyl-L-alanine--D-glutamate ligase [Jeotgalibaca ciconiae]HJB23222.1 UDP-N-acetylmuramoyl-L-alanine--D-glutamate ligase [Candidatus Jeotgalibaca pullicola]